MMRKESGFTLMELMITIAVISIVTAMVTPNILKWRQSHELNIGAQEILFTLNDARFRAVKENTHVVIDFDVSQDSYQVFIDSNDNNQYDAHTDTRLHTGNMPTGISITDAAFAGGASHIRFDGVGLPNGFGGHVTLTDSLGDMCRVVVDTTGSIRVSS